MFKKYICFVLRVLIAAFLMVMLMGCKGRTSPSTSGTETDLTASPSTKETESEISEETVLESEETETEEETSSEAMETETETSGEASSSESFDEEDIPEGRSEIDLESLNEPVDAAAFYEEYGEISSTYDAASGSAFSEAEVIEAFAERGFLHAQIVSYFSMDGTFTGFDEAEPDSTDRHPNYEGWYVSSSGEYWQISCCDNVFMASPLGYNMEIAEGKIPVVLSETDTLCSYDNTTNSYFVTQPREDMLRVIRIDVVDSAALDAVTKEVLEP